MGQFTRTADLIYDAVQPVAGLLTNGKVLIAGGWLEPNDNFPDSRTELYDPATGTFSANTNMTDGLESGAATLLPDGSVFIDGASEWHAGATSLCCRGTPRNGLHKTSTKHRGG